MLVLLAGTLAFFIPHSFMVGLRELLTKKPKKTKTTETAETTETIEMVETTETVENDVDDEH